MSETELNVKLIYLDLLKRYPSDTELNALTLQINNYEITYDELKENLYNTNEYLILTNNFHGHLEYDPSNTSNTVYDIRLKDYPLNSDYSSNYNGITIANGKIGMVSSSLPNNIDNCFITTSFDFNSIGRYANNIIQTYNCVNYEIYEPTFLTKEKNYSFSNIEQHLDMYSGILHTTYNTNLNNTSNLDIHSQLFAMRQYPYCSMQKISLSNTESYDVYLDFFHKISTKKTDDIRDTKYYNNIINHSNHNNTFFFQARGNVYLDSSSYLHLCANNCYIFENYNINDILNKGYNIDKNTNIAYNHFNIKIPSQSNLSLTIINCTMTDKDFNLPDIETNRILLNILNKSSTELIIEHKLEWAKMWESRIILQEKIGISPNELIEVNKVKRMIYFCLYNIYSVIRDDIDVEINPLNLSTIDTNGTIFWNSELWLIPLLLFLKPKAAKTLLDYRYKQLENSKKLAAAHGFKGSKFPYENDIIGYTNLYWDTTSPLYVFNTALISINTWNYFRITRDTDWLRHNGYKILKNNADFFLSKSEYDSTLGQYIIKNVISYNNSQGDNNILTNYLAKLAMRYALEASYELNYVPDSRWQNILNMHLPILSEPSTNIYENISLNSNLYINIQNIEGNDSYMFYHGSNVNDITEENEIGYTFGKYSGKYMTVDFDQEYTFHLDDSLSNYPIMFCNINGNEINITNGDAIYNSNVNGDGYYGGSIKILGSQLNSYKYSDKKYLNTYGYYAFTINQNDININDILLLDSNYSGSNINIYEPYIVLHSYYNKHFFTLPSLSFSYNKDTIKDNLLFYKNRLTEEGKKQNLNKLLELNIYSNLSQLETTYDGKTSYINTYYHLLKKFISDSTNRPWFNILKNTNSKNMFNDISLSAEFLLSLITSIGGLQITGSVNESRYYTEEYGIKQRSAFVMPITWNTLKFSKIAGFSKDFTVYNTYYNS